jgi:hypothetical protein
MERSEMFDGFEFQKGLATHDEIREIARLDLDIFMVDR